MTTEKGSHAVLQEEVANWSADLGLIYDDGHTTWAE
jgi:hypothetical protein